MLADVIDREAPAFGLAASAHVERVNRVAGGGELIGGP